MKLYPLLFIGFALLLTVILVGVIGSRFMDPDLSRAGSTPLDIAPSREYLLGTDSMGRDVLAVMLRGTPLTLQVGFMAATIGMGIGIVLGFVGGFYGGIVDTVFKGLADILITIPALLILVVVAVSLTGPVSINVQALVIASVSWMLPTRTIRAQVLTMRERAYVSVAELSGANRFEIIFLEILPNLLPYLAASFAATVAIAILTTVGMDALGLGPQNVPTLGNTVYWALFYSAPLRGLYWWWAPPIITLGVVFIGLYLITAGLDKIANPRLRSHG
ncbi:MAG: ABC transporter permease [Chloroflexi bacterium]|nr:ABC transporter permease [Chloroflexota bacterium]MCI0774241.1 ABC transporter permease [Chloroflexota bacterium]MCI0803424.1 ABC transporter permease [Chloroflexota bacterium]MCI0808240.1 ABC transporter permease [Chloroflexota bacterium]MCI0833300.1 ABC transporter permease [Chloroflexota bacterium]